MNDQLRRSNFKYASALIASGLTALLLAGCATGTEPEEFDLKALDAAWQAERFDQYYSQEIDWFECAEEDGYDAETSEDLAEIGYDTDQIGCAYVQAPFDWEDPDNSETLELLITHLPATSGAALGTLMWNPGGPGEPAISGTFSLALDAGFADVGAAYDLLGFDPRGIGGSTPLECSGGGSDIMAVQIGTCVEESPISMVMGTSQAARDMDLLRVLMGDEQLNFLGYSYGTMLGATYATIFPEQVGRMVLDSAESAAWASPIHLYDQSVAASKAIAALATSCETDYSTEVEVCPFVDEATLLSVMNDLDTQPLLSTNGYYLDGEALYGYLRMALYSDQTGRAEALNDITLALFGDQEAIDLVAGDEGLSDETSDTSAGLPYGIDLSFEMVTCNSFPIDPNIAGLIAHIDDVGVPLLMGGPEVSDELLAQYADLSCFALPTSGLDITEVFEAADAAPILVIGVTGDHATPYQYAEELVAELGGQAQLITLEGQGHAASFSARSVCIDEAVTSYLIEDKLPKAGAVCADS